MKFFIDHTALERLTDSNLEIRQNALKEITSIIKNNILIELRQNPFAHDEFCVVNLEVLARQLILWFKYRPVTNENEVFDLLIMIFSREDFLRHITKTFSLERLRKEMIKISRLLIPEESSVKLEKIEDILARYERTLLVDVANETGSFVEPKKTDSNPPSSVENFIIDRMNKLKLASIQSEESSKCDETKEDAFEFWINLDGENLDTFNYIDTELLNFKDKERLSYILQFLATSINDFPPEFYLQPPNILESLLDIVLKVSKNHSIDILRIINTIVSRLKQRYMEASQQGSQFIPIKKHINKIVQMFTNFFEKFHDNFSSANLDKHQQILNAIYLILFDMIELLENSENVCDIYFNNLLNMIAKVARDFRQNYSKTTSSNGSVCRLNYIVVLYLINAFVSRVNIEHIDQHHDNNLWEFECELSLLDWTLSISHQQIYSLVKRNANPAIKDDKDLMLLLNIEATWKPVVNLFQNWETLSDENLIYRGLKCLDTIRIHKSVELVELLFKTIVKCAEKFKTMNRLRNAAEDIFLRLLSIDMPDIRLKAYTLAKEYVQKKLTDDHDDKLKSSDLCDVIGIPITTEIITEVLCFGYCDSNPEIYKHAKLILFALLRSKVIFPNHWDRILETMRPVLPLVACIFNTDHKLGFFSFDIFHQYSGFDDNEINQAFVRFLFCSHSKAREMAKIKLLENLGIAEFTNEFIEIVPDSFCILPSCQVTDLQMPDRNVKYDAANYETVKNVLSAINLEDVEILQSVLLQLCIQMNSTKICHQSHDDNLWVFFIANLDMGYPENKVIRQLTLSILYKWTITIQSFRIYLSNEPAVLQFLIKTLIYFQEDSQVKLLASSLLFLLAFSDFIVTTDRTISLPRFIKYLECPFKFEEHWIESPFNKITQLELLYEALEVKEDNMGVQEVTLRYLRFTFGNVWFNKSTTFTSAVKIEPETYYRNFSDKTLKVNPSLFLTDTDNRQKKHTLLSHAASNACKYLENATTVDEMTKIVNHVTCSLMLPNMFVTSFAEQLEIRIQRFMDYEADLTGNRPSMLALCIEFYEKLAPWLTDSQIVGVLERKPILLAFATSEKLHEAIYDPTLKLINSIVKICESRTELSNKILIKILATHKVHFSNGLIEKLCDDSIENVMKAICYTDNVKISSIQLTLAVVRNVLRSMPVDLDDKFVNQVFAKLMKVARDFLKLKQQNFVNIHLISQIFGVIEVLTSLKCRFELRPEYFTTIFLWIKENEKIDPALIWSIIGNLTRTKDSFDYFCNGFMTDLSFSLIDFIYERSVKNCRKSSHEQKALSLILGNFLDHSTSGNELKVKSDLKQIGLISKFFNQKPLSYDIISFLVKKMIQNKVPETTAIVKQMRIVEKVLGSTIDNLDMVIMCYAYEDLKEHVCNVVVNMPDRRLMELLSNMQNSSSHEAIKAKKTEKYRKTNQNILNILSILISTPNGTRKVRKSLFVSGIFESFMMAIFSGLKVINSMAEIIFYLKFLNSLLDAFAVISTDMASSIFGHLTPEIVKNKQFERIPEEIAGDGSKNSILETNFHRVRYGADLFLLQAVNVFNLSINSKQNNLDLQLCAFVFIRNLLNHSCQAQKFANDMNLQEWILEKGKTLMNSPLNAPMSTYAETLKKFGAQKCLIIAKNMCIYLKAITEWKLPQIENKVLLKDLFDSIKKVYLWFENSAALYNCLLQFIQHISTMSIVKSCIMQEINGSQFLKSLLKKIQSTTTKIPHTETNLMLLQNGLFTIEKCCHLVDVRLVLKTTKIFQILDLLHPQIQSNKKSTWNEVALMWLEFFDVLSRYEDCDCTPGQISLLCRIFRIGTQKMKLLSLKIIRNLSITSTLGNVVIISDDFMQTIDLILLENGSKDEKLFVLQTLLSIASKSEQSRSKLKNSSFNRKLKEHIVTMEATTKQANDPEMKEIFNLASILKEILYD